MGVPNGKLMGLLYCLIVLVRNVVVMLECRLPLLFICCEIGLLGLEARINGLIVWNLVCIEFIECCGVLLQRAVEERNLATLEALRDLVKYLNSGRNCPTCKVFLSRSMECLK